MDRRAFLATLTGGLLAAPLAIEAQPQARVARIGVIPSGSPATSAASAGIHLAAEAQGGYKPEFKLSVVVNEDTAWGRAAIRFADAVRSRTAGRTQVKPHRR